VARNPVSEDSVSKGVAERAKAIVEETRLRHLLRETRNAEAKLRVYYKTPVGRTVLSALVFGGLTDWAALTEIYDRLCRQEGPPTDGWLDYTTAATSEYPPLLRRWMVDSRTGEIWRDSLKGFKEFARPDLKVGVRAAVMRHLAATWGRHCTAGELDQLFGEARVWWRQNLPPVLSVHLEGGGPSRAVPRRNWDRLLGNPLSETEQASDDTGAGATSRARSTSSGQRTRVVGDDELEKLWSDLRSISAKLSDPTISAAAKAERSTKAAGLLKKVHLQSPIAQHLQSWILECLQCGYDHRRGRRKRSGFVSPSTLLNDLSSLKSHILPELAAFSGTPDPATLIALYSAKLPDAQKQDAVRRRLRLIERFHTWLTDNEGYPRLRFTYRPRGPQNSVLARLVSEREYFRALDLAKDGFDPKVRTSLRVGLILGFRAGLRPTEMLGLQAGDFRIGSEGLVLIVKPNRHASLKTSNARRLLPLHLLLTPSEKAEVETFVRSRLRLRGKTVDGPMLLHGGANPHEISAQEDLIFKLIEQILKEVTGDPKARFYDLRHSFASYLSATLLLPPGLDARVADSIGPDCVSRARRDLLWPHLIGHKSAGRSSLYAVSFLMGHASPEWTLVYYNHLLDWSAGQYAAHVASRESKLLGFERTEDGTASNVGQGGDAAPASSIGGEKAWPEWQFALQALSDLIDGASLSHTAAASGIDQRLLGEWHKRLSKIVGLKTRTGRHRHRFVSSSSKQRPTTGSRPRFLLPRRDPGLDIIERVWNACQKGINNAPAVGEALTCFLYQADPARCDVPFGSVEEAMGFVEALKQLGLDYRSFRVRLQPLGMADRSDLLELPDPRDGVGGWSRLSSSTLVKGEPIADVSRFRISIGSDEAAGGRAMPSGRVALLLAAAVGNFSLR